MPDVLTIADTEIPRGKAVSIQIPVARPYGQADVYLPTRVVRGRESGPRLFVSAAIHGDEINGVEIIRRLLRSSTLKRLRGTLIAVPVVNVYGFQIQSRYLPDRRDLNRTFPGSKTGSLAGRLAHQFMTHVVAHATHGIDLHTGAIHRANLPQIRACLDQPETEKLARAFGAPVILNANLRDGSLRQSVLEKGVPMLVYEAGEALRFDEIAIRAGVRGVLSVMRTIGMLPPGKGPKKPSEPFVARSSLWVRAPDSGIFRAAPRLGTRVAKDERVGFLSDPFGENEVEVRAPASGVVIGRTNLPLVNEGDALLHIACFEKLSRAMEQVEAFQEALAPQDPSVPVEPTAS